MQECSQVILIEAKFLCHKSPQPAVLQFHSDWWTVLKKGVREDGLKERRNKGKKGV